MQFTFSIFLYYLIAQPLETVGEDAEVFPGLLFCFAAIFSLQYHEGVSIREDEVEEGIAVVVSVLHPGCLPPPGGAREVEQLHQGVRRHHHLNAHWLKDLKMFILNQARKQSIISFNLAACSVFIFSLSLFSTFLK